MYSPRHRPPPPAWARPTRLDLTAVLGQIRDTTNPGLLPPPADPWPEATWVPIHHPPR